MVFAGSIEESNFVLAKIDCLLLTGDVDKALGILLQIQPQER